MDIVALEKTASWMGSLPLRFSGETFLDVHGGSGPKELLHHFPLLATSVESVFHSREDFITILYEVLVISHARLNNAIKRV